MLLLKLAFLNIGRNLRRSSVTIIAISAGLTALIFIQAFMDGSKDQQRDNAIRLSTGHVQIVAKDFDTKLSPELTLPKRVEILEKIQTQTEIVAVTERVKAEGLIGTTENSRGVLLVGIDPEGEKQVTDIYKYIAEGEYLSRDDDRGVIIGHKLAEKINTELGGKVVVMTQAMDGTLAGYAYRVKGILKASNRFLDEMALFLTTASMQELLGIEKETHEIVIRLKDRASIDPFLRHIEPSLNPEKYTLLTWDDIIPEIDQWGKWANGITQIVIFSVMLVISIGIMNTILMSIFERTKELGVMMAIGTSPSQVVRLILLETFVLEIAGIILGILGGYLIVSYYAQVGIIFEGAEEAFAQAYMSAVTYPKIHFYRVVSFVKVLFVITFFAGLYPAWKASRMEPVKAIYHS